MVGAVHGIAGAGYRPDMASLVPVHRSSARVRTPVGVGHSSRGWRSPTWPRIGRRPSIAGVLCLVVAAALILTAWAGPVTRAQSPDEARVRVLHASPDAPPVDVYLDDALVLESLAPETVSGWLGVAPGQHRLLLFASGADPTVSGALVDATLAMDAGTARTLAMTNVLASLEVQLIPDAPEPQAGVARLRVVNLDADAGPVDVAVAGAGEPIVTGLADGSASPIVTLAPGVVDLQIRPAGAGGAWTEAVSGGLPLVEGTATSLFLVDLPADGDARTVVASDGASGSGTAARLRVLHGAPAARPVDVLVDGATVATDVTFGSITDPLVLAPGEHRVQVVLDSTGAPGMPDATVLVDVVLSLGADDASTLVVIPAADGFAAQSILDDPTPRADAAQLRVVNLAPDLPTVDVVRDRTRRALIERLAYPVASEYRDVRPGRLDLELRAADKSGRVVLDVAPLTLAPGTSTSLFVVGSLADGALRAVVVTDIAAP